MESREADNQQTLSLRAALLKNLRAEKIGLSHPLVKATFSEEELRGMQENAEKKNLIIIDDLGPTGRLDEAGVEELQQAIVVAEKEGFDVPRETPAELYSARIRVMVNLTLDPESVERKDFSFEMTPSAMAKITANAGDLEQKISGLTINFTEVSRSGGWDGGAMKKIRTKDGAAHNPELPLSTTTYNVDVKGMPVGLYDQKSLELYLGLE